MSYQDALEWCDSNMHRRYPLADAATCMSTSGKLLPDSFIVDAQIETPSVSIDGMDDLDMRSRFFISSVTGSENALYIELSFQYGGDVAASFVCARTGAIPRSIRNTDTVDSRVFPLYSTGSTIPSEYSALSGITGHIIIGTCIDMADVRSLSFIHDSTRIISLRVIQRNSGISSIKASTSDGTLWTLNDGFTIQAGEGIDLSLRVQGNQQILYISLSESPSTVVNNYMTAMYGAVSGAIKMINGIKPDANGAFTVSGLDCVDVTAVPYGIKISNSCSKPCISVNDVSGESDIQDMENAITNMEQAQTRLEKEQEALQGAIDALQSRLTSLIVAGK